jgi:hypothetical protein
MLSSIMYAKDIIRSEEQIHLGENGVNKPLPQKVVS